MHLIDKSRKRLTLEAMGQSSFEISCLILVKGILQLQSEVVVVPMT